VDGKLGAGGVSCLGDGVGLGRGRWVISLRQVALVTWECHVMKHLPFLIESKVLMPKDFVCREEELERILLQIGFWLGFYATAYRCL
jgi:hypothetical protein